MIDYIIKGGPLMVPIMACSVIALAIILERFYSLRSSKIHPHGFVSKMKRILNEGKVNEAIAICANTIIPISTIIESGILKRNQSREQVKEAIEHAGKREAIKIQQYHGVLATIAVISPLLGLLGTVTGMINVFEVISQYGVGQPAEMAKGISQALITTAAGLLVAIPTLVAHNYFQKKAHNYIMDMENTSMELLDILMEQTDSKEDLNLNEFYKQ